MVPDPYRFPRRVWDDGPELFDWDAPAWCDPGDPDEWIATATARHAPADRELAAHHAREDYESTVKIRAERVDRFTAMCRRAGGTAPATLAQLLDCLLHLDLYRREVAEGQEWLLPRLFRNPLDVLPLTIAEAATEAQTQHHEHAMLVGAGLRRLALADGPVEGPTVTVTAALRAIARHAGVQPGQVRAAVTLLAGDNLVDSGGVDVGTVGVDAPVAFRLAWRYFDRGFDFAELPPPEHL